MVGLGPKKMLLRLALIFVAGILACFIWLLGTNKGAVWLLETIFSRVPIELHVQQISGSLIGDLRLNGIRISWDGGGIEALELGVNWEPSAMFLGHFNFSEVTLQKAVLRINPSSERVHQKDHPVLFWPQSPAFLSFFNGTIQSLNLEQVRLVKGSDPAFFTGSLAGRVDLREGVLSLSDMRIQSSWGEAAGDLLYGLTHPVVGGSLDWKFPKTVLGANRLMLEMTAVPRKGSLVAAGLKLTAYSNQAEMVRAAGDLRMFENRLELDRLVVSHRENMGKVEGQGALRLTSSQPRIELDTKLVGLDLFTELGVKTSINGVVSLEGTLEDYSGGFSLSNDGPDWRHARVNGIIDGSLDSVKFSSLDALWLDGEIGGQLSLDWAQEFSLSAKLSAKKLDPALLGNGWPEGRVNFDARGDFSLAGDQPGEWNLVVDLQESLLRGQRLTGHADLGFRGNELHVEDLRVEGDGIRVRASGRYPENIKFNASVSNLAGLLPVEVEQGVVNGWIGWRDRWPFGSIEASFKRISGLGADVDGVRLSIERKASGEHPISVALRSGKLSYAKLNAEALEFSARGTLEHHRANAQMRWASGSAGIDFSGSLAQKTWLGTVGEMVWRQQDVGTWRLQDRAEISISEKTIDLTELILVSDAHETVRMRGQMGFNPRFIGGSAQWSDLNLAYLNAWLSGTEVSGTSDGLFEIRQVGSDVSKMLLQAKIAGLVRKDKQEFRFQQMTVETLWDHSGLAGKVHLQVTDKEKAFGRFSSVEPVKMSLPSSCSFRFDWQDFPLQPLSLLLSETIFTGDTTGYIDGGWDREGGLPLSGEARFSGDFSHGPLKIAIPSGSAEFAWSEKGLDVLSEATVAETGKVSLSLHSAVSSRQWTKGIPDTAAVEAKWKNLDLAMGNPWYPSGMDVRGTVSGLLHGRLLSPERFEIAGETSIDNGHLEWQTEGGRVSAPIRKADMEWNWSQLSLRGKFSMNLGDYGQGKGELTVPFPARFPLALDEKSPLEGTLVLDAREQGLLTSFFPGLVQESTGKIGLDLHVGGSISNPDLSGDVHVKDGGAYLPSAGIQIKDVDLSARLTGNRIDLLSFQCRSGGGLLEGTGNLSLLQWHLGDYHLKITGDRFQAVNLPDLQMRISPDLTVSGKQGETLVTGEILLPDLLILGKQAPATQRVSHDVIIIDEDQKADSGGTWDVKAQIRIVLGKHVLVKVGGLDARLEGALAINMLRTDNITAQGQISVAEGAYAAYGVRLDISKGSIVFAGGPVDQPSLDILALRKVGEVEAGVQISGTPKVPVVKLYSDPAMPDTDILSYVVLGHPMGGESQNSGALMLAAGALLSKGESTVLQDKIQRRLGLDVLDIETSNEDVSQSVVTVGKYLNPDLYISLGHSLYNQTNEVRLRYTISKRWELETEMGTVSGADLFYKIEFR